MFKSSNISWLFLITILSVEGFQTIHPVQTQISTRGIPHLYYAALEDSSIVDLCDDNHKEILFGEKPVLIDVHAKWCGPCKLIEPMINQCAQKYADKIDIVKFDVEQKDKLVKMDFLKHKLLVRKLPSIILYKGGKAVAMISGLINEDDIDKLLEEHILAPQEEEKTIKEKSGAGFINLAALFNRQD